MHSIKITNDTIKRARTFSEKCHLTFLTKYSNISLYLAVINPDSLDLVFTPRHEARKREGSLDNKVKEPPALI